MCLASIAFTLPLWAQKSLDKTENDTLQIRLQGRNLVYITGKSLKALTEYKRADSLKTLFLEDLKKSFAANAFAENPKRIHYFVNQQGKRRLKAEVNEDDAAKFDLEFEKKRMRQDLPPLHYTIYDLPKNIEIHCFLEDTTALAWLRETSLNDGVKVLEKDRRKLTGLSSYRLEKTGFGFEKRNAHKRDELRIELQVGLGALLFGNQPSPLIGYDIWVTLPHIPKASTNNFRLGFSYNAFVLTDFSEGQFRSVNPGSYWSGMLQSNFGLQKDTWLGISAGQISTWDPSGLPKNAFKTGLIVNYERNVISFDAIEVDKYKFSWGKRRQMYMVTYKRSIL